MITQSTTSDSLWQPPPISPAEFLQPPPLAASPRRVLCWVQWRKTTQAVRLQQLLFLLLTFCSISLWAQTTGWVGNETADEVGDKWENKAFLINWMGHSGSAWGKRQSDLCVHPEGCGWENIIKTTPQSHHLLQLIFTEHPLRHWPWTQNYKLSQAGKGSD